MILTYFKFLWAILYSFPNHFHKDCQSFGCPLERPGILPFALHRKNENALKVNQISY